MPDATSTRDLFGHGFVLLTADRHAAWATAAAGLRPHVAVHHLDEPARTRYQLTEDAAVLIRPDGIIGWRSTQPDALATALQTILGR